MKREKNSGIHSCVQCTASIILSRSLCTEFSLLQSIILCSRRVLISKLLLKLSVITNLFPFPSPFIYKILYILSCQSTAPASSICKHELVVETSLSQENALLKIIPLVLKVVKNNFFRSTAKSNIAVLKDDNFIVKKFRPVVSSLHCEGVKSLLLKYCDHARTISTTAFSTNIDGGVRNFWMNISYYWVSILPVILPLTDFHICSIFLQMKGSSEPSSKMILSVPKSLSVAIQLRNPLHFVIFVFHSFSKPYYSAMFENQQI